MTAISKFIIIVCYIYRFEKLGNEVIIKLLLLYLLLEIISKSILESDSEFGLLLTFF